MAVEITGPGTPGATTSGSPGVPGTPVASSAWQLTNSPGPGIQASAVQAAGAAGVRNVCTSLSFSIVSSATVAPGAPGAQAAACVLLDGGATIWQLDLPIFSAAGQFAVITVAVTLVGTAATSMTVQFSSAVAAHLESVSANGYQVS